MIRFSGLHSLYETRVFEKVGSNGQTQSHLWMALSYLDADMSRMRERRKYNFERGAVELSGGLDDRSRSRSRSRCGNSKS